MSNNEIIYELFNFAIVAVIFIVTVAIVFNIFCRKFKFDKKNIELYGLFLNLDTPSLIAIAVLTVNYLFLVWCTISFNGLNVIYVAFIFILVFISDCVLDNFKGLPFSMLLAVIDCAAIWLISMIYNYLSKEVFSYLLLIILLLLIIFVFLYYTYNLFRQINNIVVKHKYLKNKKYKN